MAIDFPAGPTNGQLFTPDPPGNKTWVYSSAESKWQSAGGVVGPAGATGPIALAGVNSQTGTSYNLVSSDEGKLVTFNNASAITVTVPTVASASWRTGAPIYLCQIGVGQVTVQGASGVTISTTMTAKTRSQYSTLSLIHLGSNSWILTGDMAAT